MSKEQRPTETAIAAASTLHSSQSKLIRNAGKLFSSTTAAAVIGAISFVLTARTLGAQEYGALALVVGFTAAILRLCEFQGWQALIKYAAHYQAQNLPGHVAALFKLGFIVDFSACFFAFAVAAGSVQWAASVFDWQPKVLQAAELYLFVLLISASGTATALMRYFDRFDFIGWHHITGAAIKLIAVLAVMRTAPNFENFIYAWMACHVIEYLILLALAARIYASRLGGLSKVEHTRNNLAEPSSHHMPVALKAVATTELFRFLLTSNLDSSLRMVRELDVQIVALFLDERAAGILRVARQLAGMAGRLLDAFYTAIYPDLAHLAAQQKWQMLRRFVARTALQVGLLALLGMATFALIGDWLLTWVLGTEYAAAYPLTLILLAAMAVWGFAQPLAPAVLAAGRPGVLLSAHCLAALAYLSSLMLLVTQLGMAGAAYALVLLYTIWAALVWLFYQRTLPRFDVDEVS